MQLLLRALAIQEVTLLLMLLLPLLLLALLRTHQPLHLNLLQAVYGPSHPEVKFTLEGQISGPNTKTHLYAAQISVLTLLVEQIYRKLTPALETLPGNKSTPPSFFQKRAQFGAVFVLWQHANRSCVELVWRRR